jgi:hypothetical protein
MESPTDGVWVHAGSHGCPASANLHARFVAHACPPHTHDTWTLFLVDMARSADLGRRAHNAEPSMVSILPPCGHDGRPADGRLSQARAAWNQPDREHLISPAVDPRSSPPRCAASLEIDLLACVERPGAEADRGSPGDPGVARQVPTAGAALAVCERLRSSMPPAMVTSDRRRASAQNHAPARSFTTTFGIAPHRYVLAPHEPLAIRSSGPAARHVARPRSGSPTRRT